MRLQPARSMAVRGSDVSGSRISMNLHSQRLRSSSSGIEERGERSEVGQYQYHQDKLLELSARGERAEVRDAGRLVDLQALQLHASPQWLQSLECCPQMKSIEALESLGTSLKR